MLNLNLDFETNLALWLDTLSVFSGPQERFDALKNNIYRVEANGRTIKTFQDCVLSIQTTEQLKLTIHKNKRSPITQKTRFQEERKAVIVIEK